MVVSDRYGVACLYDACFLLRSLTVERFWEIDGLIGVDHTYSWRLQREYRMAIRYEAVAVLIHRLTVSEDAMYNILKSWCD